MAVVLETFGEQIYGGTRQRRWRRYKMSVRKEADGAGWQEQQQHVAVSSGSPAPATVLLLRGVWQDRW